MSFAFQTHTNKALIAILFVAVWLALAGSAMWSLRPAPADQYVPPQGWRHFGPSLGMQDILLNGKDVWIAGIGGLVLVDISGGTARDIPVAGASTEKMLRDLSADSTGQIWIAHRNGLSRMTTAGQTIAIPETASAGAMRALALDASGQLWAGGENGLFRVAQDGKLSAEPLPVSGVEVSALLAGSSRGLWVGTTQHGLMRLGNGWSTWGVQDGLPHPQVTSLLQHSSGDVWVGTGFYSKGGAVRFKQGPSGWQIGETLSGETLAGPKVRSVFEDSVGRMWFGHEYNGITVREDGETRATLTKAQGLPDHEVTVIREGAMGGLWLGTLKGVLHLNRAAVEKLFSEKFGENDDP